MSKVNTDAGMPMRSPGRALFTAVLRQVAAPCRSATNASRHRQYANRVCHQEKQKVYLCSCGKTGRPRSVIAATVKLP